jgi:hypothetical protein
MLLLALAYTRTLTPLSLCLSATLPFPLSLKRCCDTAILINRNIDFSVFGYLISKVTPSSKFERDIEKRKKKKIIHRKMLKCQYLPFAFLFSWCHDTQPNDIPHNDAQHMILPILDLIAPTGINDTEHNDTPKWGFYCNTLHKHNSVFFAMLCSIMERVVMLIVILGIVMKNVVITAIMLSVIMLS